MTKPRILLDTNVWSYVVDGGRHHELARLARNGGWLVQIAPSVVLETLRFKDVTKMRTIVGLQTKPHFHRLMPEAFSEVQELLAAIRRLRPGWLRETPDLRFLARLEEEWSRKGFWRRCQQSPDDEAAWLRNHEGNLAKAAHDDVAARRKEMLESGWKGTPSLDKIMAKPARPTPGWKGDLVEAWRVERLEEVSRHLTEERDGRRGWLGPYLPLDGGLLFSEQWNDFWLYQTQASDLPRQWLRWAHKFSQRFRAVSRGSSGDTQLFSYFLDTDMVVSADKGLYSILEDCRPAAPCKLPSARLIRGEPAGVKELLELLASEPSF